MTTHATLSASGASRWTSCAGSVAAEAEHKLIYGAPKSSKAAEIGTRAHQLAEDVLTGKLKSAKDDETVTDEMAQDIQGYVNYVNDRQFDTFSIEQRVHYSDVAAKGFGTADVVGIKGKTLYVIDLKYGRYPVQADQNLQGILYLLGAWKLYPDSENFVFEIYQPRIDNYSKCSYTKKELISWSAWLKERATLAMTKGAPRTASSDACKFCAAKSHCSTYFNFMSSILGKPSDNLDEYNDDHLLNIMAHKAEVIDWLNSVEAYLKDRLQDGRQINGLSLAKGRKMRGWHDENAVAVKAEELEYDPYETKLMTPAKLQKLMGKDYKHIEDLEVIKHAADKLIIAKDTDLFDEVK